MEPYSQIIQSWRTTEFDESDPDSEVTLEFIPIAKGCEMTIIHRNIPDGQPDYKKGWKDFYFNPMKAYFKQ